MKKLVLLLIAVFTLSVFPVASEATTNEVTMSDADIAQENQISPRGVYTYKFSYVPPQKFNGMTRVYYEYYPKEKVYVGYYMG